MISITRRYRFSASHRLHSSALSAAENARIFGKCNNPFGHGHDYTLEVTATGNVNPESGLILPVLKLDRLVQDHVLQLFAYRNLNFDVPQFADLVPTTENVATVIADLLQKHWAVYLGSTGARLLRVHIQETERNGFDVVLTKAGNAAPSFESENVTVNA